MFKALYLYCPAFLVGMLAVHFANFFMANGFATALSPYGSSPQAVSPVPASIAFAGDTQ